MYLSDLILLIVFIAWIAFTVYKKKKKKENEADIVPIDKGNDMELHTSPVIRGNVEILSYDIPFDMDELKTSTMIEDIQKRLNTELSYYVLKGIEPYITYQSIQQRGKSVLLVFIH